MNVAWLEVFREVAARGSFTAAAGVLGYTQSAVSRQVAALEAEVGSVLFEREARGVRLTEAGRCLVEHAEAVLNRVALARRGLDALRGVAGGRLRIGAFPTATTVLVPRAVALFHERHPDVALSLAEGLTPALADRVREGDLDLALVTDEPAGLVVRHLVDDPLLVAIPRGHRLAARRTVRLSELADEAWIAGSSTLSDTLIGLCLRSGFAPRVRYEVREWSAKHGLVAAGLGVTMVSGLASGAARADILIKRLHPDDVPVRPVYAATRRAEPPAAVQAFLDVLDTVLDEMRGELAELAGARYSQPMPSSSRSRP
ncbi:LysR family transcriptional regulator [Actinokineospora soli]